MEIERRLAQLGIELPDFGGATYYGVSYGRMKPYHRTGPLLFLSGHIPEKDGQVVHPGRLGQDLTVEQGYACRTSWPRSSGRSAGSGAGRPSGS